MKKERALRKMLAEYQKKEEGGEMWFTDPQTARIEFERLRKEEDTIMDAAKKAEEKQRRI